MVEAWFCWAEVGSVEEPMKLIVSWAPVSLSNAVIAAPEDWTRWTGKVPARSTSVGFRAIGEAWVEPCA